jgi:hypothetical protein
MSFPVLMDLGKIHSTRSRIFGKIHYTSSRIFGKIHNTSSRIFGKIHYTGSLNRIASKQAPVLVLSLAEEGLR